MALAALVAIGGLSAVFAAFAGPAAYSLYTVRNTPSPSNPTGGPAASARHPSGGATPFDNPGLTKVLARLTGSRRRKRRQTEGPPVAGVSPEMIQFLKAHRQGASWIVAVGDPRRHP